MAIPLAVLTLTLFSSLLPSSSSVGGSFDVRHHLSTVTRYDAGKEANVAVYQPPAVPDGCTPFHLNLVARHGTRAPTKKRIQELDRLAIRLESLLSEAKQAGRSIPSWLSGWKSPWKGRKRGGELVSEGENELYDLGIRVRERFPELFKEEYHPDVFTIRATQVTRASASAVAFGIGLFSGKGSLGPGRHRAFSVISESRASDIWLRFHDNCETYKQYRKSQEPAVGKLKEPILDEVTSALVKRYHLNFTRQDIASLWFLCKQEASLLQITDQACGLFSASEVSLLEWTDDLEVFLLKGYGNSINYHMGIPLLKDIHQSIEQAIAAREENLTPGTFEKARLRFAHAETVIPFICLLGRNRAQQHPAERSIGIRTSRKHLPFPGGFSDAEENNLLQPMLLDLIRRLAGGGAIASILVSQFLAPLNNSAANAVLYSPDTKVPRTGELALRRAIPANSNVKAIQDSLEDISYLLRIPQRKPYGTMEGNVKKALKIAIKEKESILGSVPEDFKERGSLLYTSLIDGKGALQNLIQAIKENDPDKVSVSLASSLDTLAEIELLQAPGLSFLLPEQYLKYPRLTGRGTVEFTIEKDAGTAFFPIAGGQPQSLAKIQVILDGYSAPLTTGNFAKLVLDGAYDGARLKCTDQAVLVDSKLENSGYSVPLEVMPSGQFEPLYKTTLSIQDGELPVLPLSVYGSVAMAHSTDSEEYSSPSQFFFYLYDKRNAGLGGLSFDEGQFSVFGYTTIGREVLSQIKSGDLIRSAKLVEGRDRLMLPAETNQKLS